MSVQDSEAGLEAGVIEPPKADEGSQRFDVVRKRIRWLLWEANLLIIPLVLIVIGLAFFSDVFLTSNNIQNVLRTASLFIVLGVGQTFVITSGNIDLSIGSMMALVMALSANLLIDPGMNLMIVIVGTLLMGAAFGTINGLIVTKLKVPALLATLGGLIAYRGLVQQYMYGEQYMGFPDAILALGRGQIGPLPIPVLIALVTAAFGAALFRYTRFGRYTIAIGSNEEAARRAGISVDRWKVAIFAYQGAMVGLAGLLLMGRMNAAHPNMGAMNELHAIAGVVLGGTLLFGGFGTMFGTVLAMILIAVLENGLLLAGAGFFWQQIFLGALIVIAVASQVFRNRARKET